MRFRAASATGSGCRPACTSECAPAHGSPRGSHLRRPMYSAEMARLPWQQKYRWAIDDASSLGATAIALSKAYYDAVFANASAASMAMFEQASAASPAAAPRGSHLLRSGLFVLHPVVNVPHLDRSDARDGMAGRIERGGGGDRVAHPAVLHDVRMPRARVHAVQPRHKRPRHIGQRSPGRGGPAPPWQFGAADVERRRHLVQPRQRLYEPPRAALPKTRGLRIPGCATAECGCGSLGR